MSSRVFAVARSLGGRIRQRHFCSAKNPDGSNPPKPDASNNSKTSTPETLESGSGLSTRTEDTGIEIPKKPTNFVEAYDAAREIVDAPMEKIKRGYLPYKYANLLDTIPSETDFLIVGGGLIGSSIAYWLKKRMFNSIAVTIIERDPAYERCAISRSTGVMRQQFSLPENIQMSLFSARFLSEYKNYLGKNAPDPQFKPESSMLLATSEKDAEKLEDNIRLQGLLGGKAQAMSKTMLEKRFPFMNFDDVKLGSYGLRNEGSFDPWALLQGLKQENLKNSVGYVCGEVVDFRFHQNPGMERDDVVTDVYEPANHVIVRLPTGELRQIIFPMVIVAAGAQSGHVGRLLRIGTHPRSLSVPIPVEPRRRSMYSFHSPDLPPIGFPSLTDGSGVFCRQEGWGGHFVCGQSPQFEDENLEEENFDFTDEKYFRQNVWSKLSRRIPLLEGVEPEHFWTGDYDHNYFDGNPIIDYHPYYHNVLICTGFSGLGAQMAPAAAMALSERVFDSQFKTIDLSRFGFQRVMDGTPLYEDRIG